MTGYYERLKRVTRPTAAELEHQKRTSNQGPSIRELQERLESNEQATLDAANFLGRPDGEVPVDDGTAPVAPTAVAATPFYHQMDLSWSEPPSADHVLKSFVRIREGGLLANEKIVEGGRIASVIKDLPATSHTFEVQLEDRWGMRSGWSTALTKTPLLTAAESIDIGALAMLGRIQGLLPNTNLAKIEDATKLGSGIVLAKAMAVQDAAAFNLWAQNAMIQSAKISSLSVDKLVAGTFTAGNIILAGGGQIRGGGTWMDSSGIRLPFVNGNFSASTKSDFKITGPDDREAVAIFRTTSLSPNYQGVQIRGDGPEANDNLGGEVVLQSSSAGGNNGASIEIATKTGASIINMTADDIQALGNLRVTGITYLTFGAFLYRISRDANGFLRC